MGYQAPPTLPDYSKLIFMLNSSGAQQWNPAVYDILKQLIGAVKQSQDVISNNISEIINTPEVSCCDSPGPPPTTGSPTISRTQSVSGGFSIPQIPFSLNIITGVAGYLILPLTFRVDSTSNGAAGGFQNGALALALKFTGGTAVGAIGGNTVGMSGAPPPHYATSATAGAYAAGDLPHVGEGINLTLPVPGIGTALLPPNDAIGNVIWNVTYVWIRI